MPLKTQMFRFFDISIDNDWFIMLIPVSLFFIYSQTVHYFKNESKYGLMLLLFTLFYGFVSDFKH